jgi:hypothetical protein
MSTPFRRWTKIIENRMMPNYLSSSVHNDALHNFDLTLYPSAILLTFTGQRGVWCLLQSSSRRPECSVAYHEGDCTVMQQTPVPLNSYQRMKGTNPSYVALGLDAKLQIPAIHDKTPSL